MIIELAWDSQLFKRKIGRLTKVPSERHLIKLVRQADRERYSYLTCRIIAEKMSSIQLLEAHGFYTVDIGTVWERQTENLPEQGFVIKQAKGKDALLLSSISSGLFRDSRFYNDPFFTSEEAEKLYREWVGNALRDKTCRTFFIEGCGFITCQEKNNNGDIALIGVVPEKQGKGVGRSLVFHALSWFKRRNVDTLTARTQAKNIRAMNFYLDLGFRIKYTDITMGLILDKLKRGGS